MSNKRPTTPWGTNATTSTTSTTRTTTRTTTAAAFPPQFSQPTVPRLSPRIEAFLLAHHHARRSLRVRTVGYISFPHPPPRPRSIFNNLCDAVSRVKEMLW